MYIHCSNESYSSIIEIRAIVTKPIVVYILRVGPTYFEIFSICDSPFNMQKNMVNTILICNIQRNETNHAIII